MSKKERDDANETEVIGESYITHILMSHHSWNEYYPKEVSMYVHECMCESRMARTRSLIMAEITEQCLISYNHTGVL